MMTCRHGQMPPGVYFTIFLQLLSRPAGRVNHLLLLLESLSRSPV